MKHSKMYEAFIKWVDLIGTREGDYTYHPKYLDTLYDWERDEIETIIYEKFKEGNAHVIYFAQYMQYLKKYDGIEALKQYLANHSEIMGLAIEVARALYEVALEPQYVDAMMGFYKKTRDSTYVAIISDSIPSKALFEALTYIYVNDRGDLNRSAANVGMLHCKGYIQDISAIWKRSEDEMEIQRLLHSDDIEERKAFAEKLATEQQLIDGIPVPEPLY